MILRARNVEVGGGRVLVAELGSGPPLVLIHGLGGTFRYWLETAHQLARAPSRPDPRRPGLRRLRPRGAPLRDARLGRAPARRLRAPRRLPSRARRPLPRRAHRSARGRAPRPSASGASCSSRRPGSRPQRAWRRHVLLPIMRLALRNPRPWENLLGSHAWARGIVFTEMLARPRELDPFTTRMLVGGAALARQLGDSLEASLAMRSAGHAARARRSPSASSGASTTRRCRSRTPRSRSGFGPTRVRRSCLARGTCR